MPTAEAMATYTGGEVIPLSPAVTVYRTISMMEPQIPSPEDLRRGEK